MTLNLVYLFVCLFVCLLLLLLFLGGGGGGKRLNSFSTSTDSQMSTLGFKPAYIDTMYKLGLGKRAL